MTHWRLLLAGICGLALALAARYISTGASPKQIEDKVSYTRVIDHSEGAALRRWAELTCRGWTIRDLAKELGVEPTFEAIAQRLARGMPLESQAIVIRVCEKELRRSERGEY